MQNILMQKFQFFAIEHQVKISMACEIEIHEDGNMPFIIPISEQNVFHKQNRGSFRSFRTASSSSSISSTVKVNSPLEVSHSYLTNIDRTDSILSNSTFYSCRRSSSFRSYNVSPYRVKCQRQSSFPGTPRRSSSKRRSTRRRESKFSYVSVEDLGGRRRSVHIPHHRRNCSTKRKNASREISLEERAANKKRRKMVYIILGTFLFILLCCVMAVVVTLTHKSEFKAENKTLTYYTFSPDYQFFILQNKDLRKKR